MVKYLKITIRENILNILVINSGSSSLKFQIINMDTEQVLCSGGAERIGLDGAVSYRQAGRDSQGFKKHLPDHSAALVEILRLVNVPIDAVGHRLVHGGPEATLPVLINDETLRILERYTPMAPLHNPAVITGIEAARKMLPDVPQAGSFDTSYYSAMPEEAFIYPLPFNLYADNGYRKYGFHGSSHSFVNLRAADMLGIRREDFRAVSCHIGGGVTVAASIGCRGVDTSVGYGTVCGVPMGTRSGDVDPDVILHMIKEEGYSADDVKRVIYRESGLLGISGVSSDVRDVLEAADAGSANADLAIRIYTRSLRRFIGALSVSLEGRMDALIFTAGAGEKSPRIRALICSGLEVLGAELDEDLNGSCRGESIISKPDSGVKILVIPTNEELMIARQTLEIIRSIES